MPQKTSEPPVVNVICMKWGDLYGAEDVNNLYFGVRKHLKRKHRFVCFTDNPEGLVEKIDVFPIPKLGLANNDTRWQKLALFRSELADLSGISLFLDLDLVIVDSIDLFFDYPGKFLIIRDDELFRSKPLRKLNPKRDKFLGSVGNSSVFRYEIGKHSYILDAYLADPKFATSNFEISQQFQTAQLLKHGDLEYWPREWCVSFKNHCVPRNFLSYFSDPKLPKNARIVIFAGSPKMHEVMEGKGNRWYRKIGNVEWLRQAWTGNDV